MKIKNRNYYAKAAGVLAAVLLAQTISGTGMIPAAARIVREGLASASNARMNEDLTEDLATAADLDEEMLVNDLLPEGAEVLMATPANLTATPANLWRTAQMGDLWTDWNGSEEFSGEGTKEYPYHIDGIADLMGLSLAVAAGEEFEDTYFELTADVDLGGIDINYGNWNPIGWYQNAAEFAGEVSHPFRGHFDGAGNCISGLKIIHPALKLKNIGLFGVIDGGSVTNLKLEADDVYGVENVGLLAGEIRGAAVIKDVEVSGYAYSEEDAGGIAAQISGDGTDEDGSDRVTVENCRAEGIILNSVSTGGFIGGIAGNVRRAYLVDNVVITQNGDSNRIQGKGYVGGIAGRMNQTNIYNSYVSGTIGGNGSQAVGGIVGKYESGNLVLARMAGDIGRTNAGSAAREGTFIGTRESRDNFTYGTEKDSRLAYLYTTTAAKAKTVCGSTIDGDNSYTLDAHVGYWTEVAKKYVTMAGKVEAECGDRYFYEEMEDGVRYIVTQKLGREFISGKYDEGLTFSPDHFAPGYMGEPVRGYLVSVQRIDAKNANGTWDTDVAALTAISQTGSSYYRTIDKDHAAAIAPGAVVTVTTAPKNTGANRYQMIVDASEPGKVRPPVYLDDEGNWVSTSYVNGGSYSFLMPEYDTELSVEYQKVTTSLTVDPAQTRISITQTRSGDRKAPGIVTEVRNEAGDLIARYIDGSIDRSVEVQPVAVHAEHNGIGETADRSVIWSVDDEDLLLNCSESGYTTKDGYVLADVDSRFVQDILEKEETAQAAAGYQEAIRDTEYTRYAVLTAATNPATSMDNQPVYANCRVEVSFRILDQTTLRVEGLSLDKNNLQFTVTRKLTGSRYAPTQEISCSQPVILTAILTPSQPFLKQVSWSDREAGKRIRLTPAGANHQECSVTVNYDAAGTNNPAWIQNQILAEDARKKADPAQDISGKISVTEQITAVSEDQTHGHVTTSCAVTIVYETIDQTVKTTSGSGGSSGGSGGGGGGGGSTSRSAAAVSAQNGPAGLPSYVVSGTWTQEESGKWRFSDSSRNYAGEWAAVYNPYADTASGQNAFDWFYFDAEGYMYVGWLTDVDGNRYYLNPVSDGTQGRMCTGWLELDGKRCYFNEASDGTKGALKEESVMGG